MKCEKDVFTDDYKAAVEHVRKAMPNIALMEEVANIFKLCGDTTRVGIICALTGSEMCVSDLADILDMTTSAISHQLRLLKHTNIVSCRRIGRVMLYKIADKHIDDIFSTAFDYVID